MIFIDQKQQMFIETTTATPNVVLEKSWKNSLTENQLPQSTDSITQNFVTKPQTWQSRIFFLPSFVNFSSFILASQTQSLPSSIPEQTSVDNKIRLSTGMTMILETYLLILILK